MRNFDPTNWYWLADDGRLYSSAVQALVSESDEVYLAWRDETGGFPTRWPEDESGEQTDEALAEVLAPYGLRLWPPTLKEALTEYAAEKRWRVETSGVTVGGSVIDTSRASQAMITGAYSWALAHPDQPIRFKAASGWVTIDAATMAAIASAVGAHVQACFAVEAAVAEGIETGAITSTDEIDAADWPS